MSIRVRYRFTEGVDAHKHAKVIAVGQTAGTWSERWSHRADQLAGHLGTVVDVDGREATIAFPEENVEGDIGSLLTMIFGKYSMAGAAKVMAVSLPETYGTRCRHGITGVRARTGVTDRPLVMGIFKPALGLTAADHGVIAGEVARAGLDILKDDEILGNLPVAPTRARLAAVRDAIREAAETTGREMLYATNVTGRDARELLDNARDLVAHGANALLVNALPYGLSVLEALARDPEVGVPLFAHPALAGALCAAPDHGLDWSVVFGTLFGHAGADVVLMPSSYGSLPFSADDEARCRDLLRSRGVLPAPAAGIAPPVVPDLVRDYGNDVVLCAGSGIMDHADGPAGGVRAMFAALED